jgi:RNA polymerase sigma factor (sigma-70 family)
VKTDEELFLAFDSDAAFTELVTRWWAGIVGYFRRRICDYHQSEDLAIEAFTCLYRFRENYSPGRPFRIWIFFQAKMVLCRYYRSRKRRRIRQVQSDLSLEFAVAPDDSCETELFAREQTEVLGRCVTGLKVTQADGLRRLLAGATQVEIAAAHGITHQAVSLRLQGGLQRLRKDPEVMALA